MMLSAGEGARGKASYRREAHADDAVPATHVGLPGKRALEHGPSREKAAFRPPDPADQVSPSRTASTGKADPVLPPKVDIVQLAPPADATRSRPRTSQRGTLARVRLRVKRHLVRAFRLFRRVTGLEKTVYVDARRAEYRSYWEGAARRLGATFTALDPRVWEIELAGRSTRLSEYVTQIDDPVTLRIAGDKSLTHRMARSLGIPVPEHLVFTLDEIGRAQAFMEGRRGPFVVKPVRGSSAGVGITTYVEGRGELEDAAVLASLFCPDILIEALVPGESWRLLFLDGELLHAVRRRGVRVEGDGASTVRELLSALGWTDALDHMGELALQAQGLTPDDVPEAGRSVLVRSLPLGETRRAELRTVYDESATHLVSPELVRELEPLLQLIGTRLAGVDVLTTDIGAPLGETGGALIEVNTTPGIHHHYHTDREFREHPVAIRILASLLNVRPARWMEEPRTPKPRHAATS